MASNYLKLSRHGTTFYFRRRVPDDLRSVIGKRYLLRSLGTAIRREAIIRGRVLASRSDQLFENLRIMPNTTNREGLRIDFGYECHIDDSGLKKHSIVDIKPGEESAAAAFAQALGLAPGGTLGALSAAPRKGSGKLISETWVSFKAEKISTNTWADGEDTAKYDHWPHIREFIELVGDKHMELVTANDVERFQEHVIAAEHGGSASNRKKRLERSGALFRWAKVKRHIVDDFRELFRYPGKVVSKPHLKYEQSDLVSLFEASEYRNNEFKTPSEYWLPLLALFSGARLNELCQLTRDDVQEHDGVDTICILDEDIGKRLKTEASRRIIPIHSQLLRLGFRDYVHTIVSGRIFPELPENKQRVGDFGKEPSRKFTSYRRRKGVGGDSLNLETGKWQGENRKTFHSFRTTLISALRKANVPKDRRTRLAGHEYDDTQDRNYNGGDVLTMFAVQTLKEDIECVRFDVEFTPYCF